MTTIYLVRHGEVHNPEGVIYGWLPGYRLSERGRAEVVDAADSIANSLAEDGSIDVLITSPLERAQESAGILAARLGSRIASGPITEPRIAETDVAGYQGKSFDTLPTPYITEEGLPGIEGAASMRARLLEWVADISGKYERIVAVSHRDPIGVLLLHLAGADLSQLGPMGLATGSVHEIHIDGDVMRASGPALQ